MPPTPTSRPPSRAPSAPHAHPRGTPDARHLQGLVENLVWLVEQRGFVPNGLRTYYTNRSQPPLLRWVGGGQAWWRWPGLSTAGPALHLLARLQHVILLRHMDMHGLWVSAPHRVQPEAHRRVCQLDTSASQPPLAGASHPAISFRPVPLLAPSNHPPAARWWQRCMPPPPTPPSSTEPWPPWCVSMPTGPPSPSRCVMVLLGLAPKPCACEQASGRAPQGMRTSMPTGPPLPSRSCCWGGTALPTTASPATGPTGRPRAPSPGQATASWRQGWPRRRRDGCGGMWPLPPSLGGTSPPAGWRGRGAEA